MKRWNHHISHSLLPTRPLLWVSTSRQYNDFQGPGFWAKFFQLFSRALHEYNIAYWYILLFKIFPLWEIGFIK